MQRWETPHLAEVRNELCSPGDSVLEIGYGMGIMAGLIGESQPQKYTVIEAHKDIAAYAKKELSQRDYNFEVIHSLRQDAIAKLPNESFDAIWYDTYYEGDSGRATFAKEAKRLLKPGGRFSYRTPGKILRRPLVKVIYALFDGNIEHHMAQAKPYENTDYVNDDEREFHFLIATKK